MAKIENDKYYTPTDLANYCWDKTLEIIGEENIVLYGTGYIHDYIGEFKFKISPMSFYQTNPIQTEILYNLAIEKSNGKPIFIFGSLYLASQIRPYLKK